ncbi:unnamed protein product [Chondrus crispus]|uniref:ABM domain-containing protein n=1 Tax=Chondrus crispus TaxID=2769 RepID=R7QBW7_CHOCR|nr:unnamed protein product [Chondrus crispus]CDF35549.1 unnamed protein product [Chondrus crispus]|eukprot:XP_005715368.1 unnamed protein product [Chondrus crispus]
MSDKVVVFATLLAKSDSIDQVLEALTAMLEPSRKEEGCHNYDLHRDRQDPKVFVFHETWESEAHLDAHNQTPHFKNLSTKLEGIIESVSVRRTTKL